MIVTFFQEKKGYKLRTSDVNCQCIKSITEKTSYYFLEYASTKCIDHLEMLHTHLNILAKIFVSWIRAPTTLTNLKVF